MRCDACSELIGVIKCKDIITSKILCNGCADEVIKEMEV